MLDSAPFTHIRQEIMSSGFLSRFISSFYLFCFAIIGLLVAYIGYCDPDTCWHLALGRYMFMHMALPQVDPFSSNVYQFVHCFEDNSLPLIQHEWLSDYLLYSVYWLSGAHGLLVFVACLSALSLIVLPSWLMQRHSLPRPLIFACTGLTALASGFRLWVRPEQFSFLCLASLILVYDTYLATSNRKTLVLSASAVFAIIAFWTNCHALFLIGIVYCLGQFGLALLKAVSFRRISTEVWRTLALLPVAGAATFVTPWHLELWKYICKLSTSSLTYHNKENGPLALTDLLHPTFLPCLLLLTFAVVLIVRACNQAKPRRTILDAVLLVLSGTVIAALFRRLTPIGLLLVLQGMASLPQEAFSPTGRLKALFQPLFFSRTLRSIALTGVAVSAASCFFASWLLVSPVVPSPSRLFAPPYKALLLLDKSLPRGRLLNDSKFGSMITWTMKHPPDIFIDGRFDSYERQIVADYYSMRLCKSGWQQLLDYYHIGYVFFPPQAPIVVALSSDPGWSEYFRDHSAVILVRKVGAKSSDDAAVKSLIKSNQ